MRTSKQCGLICGVQHNIKGAARRSGAQVVLEPDSSPETVPRVEERIAARAQTILASAICHGGKAAAIPFTSAAARWLYFWLMAGSAYWC